MSKMEHTRKASDEGWKMLATVIVVASVLGFGTLIFDMGVIWRLIWTLILVLVSGLAIAYAGSNIRSDGTFLCRLTADEFSQSIPVASCGENFQIKLSEITQIEIHDSGGEGPSDEWYIHTENGRHRITTNYGNPDRKFGEAIQLSLPHITTIKT